MDEASRRTLAKWGRIGAFVGGFATVAFSSVTAWQADQRVDDVQASAQKRTTEVHNTARMTGAELTASYKTLVERIEELEGTLEKVVDHSKYLESRNERLEVLVFNLAAGNRRAVNAYDPPAHPDRLVAVTRKKLPESPKKALQQKVLSDPLSVISE